MKINREKERTAKLIRELQGKNTEVEIQEILLQEKDIIIQEQANKIALLQKQNSAKDEMHTNLSRQSKA